MKNVVVYTDKNESKLADVLAQIDDTNVRIESVLDCQDVKHRQQGFRTIYHKKLITST